MGWLLEIVHETRMHYQGAARASYNEARMTPLSLPSQTALQTRVSVGNGTPVWAYHDYWGTVVSSFDIQAPHDELTVRSHAVVETSPAPAAAGPAGLGRAARPGGRRDRCRVPRRHPPDHGGRRRWPRRPGSGPRAPARWRRPRPSRPGSGSGWRTSRERPRSRPSAQEAWDKGEGVCQDIAHLTVALLREAGLPARYVSGYLHPRPEAGIGLAVAGQSHAWVEYWAGDWVAADPTNQASVGEGHVVVARGRDYADVPPLKGIYHGAPSVAMDVTVEVTRLA